MDVDASHLDVIYNQQIKITNAAKTALTLSSLPVQYPKLASSGLPVRRTGIDIFS
ncbi:hypothetical protein TNCV_937751 [Trichonephila clavipes]|nr:hypothetical protein TNCV_937751 [Trichonephila clavipes]